MIDRRKQILYSIIDNHPTHGLGDEEEKIAIEAMDEYMKEVCLELLEFIGNNNIECEKWADGARFWYKNEWLTSEQLFENFL